MSTGYSAHPVLASEQLQNAEKAKNTKNTTTKTATTAETATATTSSSTKSQRHSPQHRLRQQNNTISPTNSRNDGGTDEQATTTTTIRGFFNFSPFKSKTKTAAKLTNENMPPTPTRASTPQKTLPDRTPRHHDNFPNADIDDDDYDDVYTNNYDGEPDDDDNENTKDCVDCAAPPCSSKSDQQHEPIIRHDQLQHRLNRNRQNSFGDDLAVIVKTKQLPAFSDGCPSGLSSAISSPAPSTVSSPLSTPTRLTTQLQHSHQHCCRKSPLTPGAHHHLHHHHHTHHQHPHHLASSSSAAVATAAAHSSSLSNAAAAASGCKKLQKFDPRFGPSPYRQLLPILLCILSFATVFTILIIYMDTTEIRHQQFRLNMSRDYDLYGVAQDDPDLVTFLREIHMRKYSTHFLKNRGDPTTSHASASVVTTASTGAFNFSAHHEGLVPEMAHYVADLVGGKVNGAVIQSLTGALGQLITAPWLSETLNWAGIIVEPEPRRYFTLRKQNLQRAHMQVVHACVSPNPYPKEVTIHNEESEVRINSLLDAETSWFNSRVKCFPLYTIMLACNRVEYDLLSLGVHGHELEILQTLPFDKIKIEVISLHLQDNGDKMPRSYIQTITKFLTGKGYKFQKSFGSNYFYQRINTTNRTRKKDILLLKTP